MEDLRIAQWLDAKIKEEGTKIHDLAKYVGVSVSQISKWKTGDQLLRKPEHVFKVASYYEVDPMRLLATADPAFRDQGIKPLPIPEVDSEHILGRLPRYVGKRERKLMGKIASLGSVARDAHEVRESHPTDQVERYFAAIDEMLDTIHVMLSEGNPDDDGRRADEEKRGGSNGGATLPAQPEGGGPHEPGGNTGDKRGSWSQRIAEAFRSTLEGNLAPGW